MNKSLVYVAFVAGALSAPVAAFAQANISITRAEVRAELVQLEKAGYNPASDHTHYPNALLAAEARINALEGVDAGAYGSSASGTSASGIHAPIETQLAARSLYSRR
jgi:hypothetical protein